MNYNFIDFKDQVCLITGAGSPTGIGFCTAKIMGQLGGKIAIVATTERIHERAAELEAMGITAKGYVADLMDREQVKNLIKSVADDLGAPSVLITRTTPRLPRHRGDEGLRLLHGLEANLATSLQTPQVKCFFIYVHCLFS